MMHAALSRILAGAAALSVLYQSGCRMDEMSMMAAVFSSAGLLVHYADNAFGTQRRRRTIAADELGAWPRCWPSFSAR